MSRASQHPTERDRPGLHMALAALERRQNIYPGADSIPRLLLEQIGNQGAVQEQSYDALLAERDQLRAELEAIRGKGVLYVSAESLADDGVVGMHATRKPNAVQNVALYAIPPQQPDTWPTLDKPAKVGAVLFNPGLSARLVVEAAQRQHEYSQQPEVEAARLERFGAFMREVHGENGDGGASDGP